MISIMIGQNRCKKKSIQLKTRESLRKTNDIGNPMELKIRILLKTDRLEIIEDAMKEMTLDEENMTYEEVWIEETKEFPWQKEIIKNNRVTILEIGIQNSYLHG